MFSRLVCYGLSLILEERRFETHKSRCGVLESTLANKRSRDISRKRNLGLDVRGRDRKRCELSRCSTGRQDNRSRSSVAESPAIWIAYRNREKPRETKRNGEERRGEGSSRGTRGDIDGAVRRSFTRHYEARPEPRYYLGKMFVNVGQERAEKARRRRGEAIDSAVLLVRLKNLTAAVNKPKSLLLTTRMNRDGSAEKLLLSHFISCSFFWVMSKIPPTLRL